MTFKALLPTVGLPTFNDVTVIVINFIAAALLLAVFTHNKYRNKQSKMFVAMGLSMLAWINCAYLARKVGMQSLWLSEVFLRIAWVATPLLFYFTYITSMYVTNTHQKVKVQNTVMLALSLLLSVATGFTNLVITGVRFTGGNLDIIYGVFFYPFLIVIFLIMVNTLVPLLKKRLELQARGFLAGVVIFYLLNMVFNIMLPVFFSRTHLYYIGDYSSIFLLGFTAYAIIKHKLMNIKVFSTEIVTVVLWIVLFAKLFIFQSPVETVVDLFVFIAAITLGVLLIRSVIQEIKQRERLQTLTKKLRELDKQKDEFISVAAHELRAPMTAIKGYLSMILDGDAGKISTQAQEFLDEAIQGNDRLIRLVNNMLNVARIEENRMVYQMGSVHLRKVLSFVYDEFKVSAQDKGLTFSTDIDSKVHDVVFVDKDRIYEVVSNFISNAIKYTDQGSVTVRLSNTTKKTIRFEVQDTGPGITPEEQKTLFGKFVRTQSSEKKAMGTGLGLYISKLLIEKFDGTVGVVSETGRGSTFWFELPVKNK